jgi:hypothetical protein
MNYKFFAVAVTNIIFHPGNAWDEINSANISTSTLTKDLLIPFIVLISVSAFGGSLLFANSELAVSYSVMTAVKCFIITYFSIWATARILCEITNPMDLGRDFTISFRLVVFSAVPFLVCQLFSRFFESFLFIDILALVGLYIFWIGAEKLLNPPKHKKMPLLIATFLTMVLIYAVSNLMLSKLIDKIYYSVFA